METITKPGVLLRLEGLAVFVLATGIYWWRGESLLLYLIFFLAPDLSFLGYLAGTKVGAFVYNLAHNYVLPVALGALGFVAGNGLAIALALIWAAHIGADRLLGYGLKYPTAFKDTHLSRV